MYSASKEVLVDKSEKMKASLEGQDAGIMGEIVIEDFPPPAVELFLQVLHLEHAKDLGK